MVSSMVGNRDPVRNTENTVYKGIKLCMGLAGPESRGAGVKQIQKKRKQRGQ